PSRDGSAGGGTSIAEPRARSRPFPLHGRVRRGVLGALQKDFRMPKPKTNKSVKKRIKVTKTGKVLLNRAGKGHLLSKKSAKRRRQLRKKRVAFKADATRLKKMLGLA